MLYEKLWLKFLEGDKKSLAIIFKAFYEELFNYGRKLTGSASTSEDCLQELFFKLWKNRQGIQEVGNLKAYLFTSFRHVVYDNLKWFNQGIFAEKSIEDIFVVEFSIEDILIKDQVDVEIREMLLKAINDLSSRQKEALYLRYFEGLDFNTISKIMEVNVQSARNYIHRGILALRNLNMKIPRMV